MLEINLSNIEELVFYDTKVQTLLPEFGNLFSMWKMYKMLNLRSQVQQIILKLLNSLEEKHTQILQTHFGMEVVIDGLDTHIVKNITTEIEDAECEMAFNQGYSEIAISRKGEQLYISFWR